MCVQRETYLRSGTTGGAGEVCDTLSSQGIPREVANLIIDKTSDWPIGMDEAKQAREQWTKEHNWADQAYKTGIEILLTIPGQ